MAGYTNFGRSYRLIAGPAGGSGFETTELHIAFSLEKPTWNLQHGPRGDVEPER